MNSAAYAATRAIIVKVLAEHGWTVLTSPALGGKTFVTAVGEKEALAYLTAGDEFNRTIQGDYQSEGRNALSSNGVLISKDADDAEVARLAAVFAVGADKAVGETYAMRLLRDAEPVAA